MDEQSKPSMAGPPDVKQASGENDHDTSAYNTHSHDQDPTADGSLSITLNIRNLMKEYDDDDANNPNSRMLMGILKGSRSVGAMKMIM